VGLVAIISAERSHVGWHATGLIGRRQMNASG
jgi:hypothetical protein